MILCIILDILDILDIGHANFGHCPYVMYLYMILLSISDTVAMYLLALADQCGCSVFAASCDVETCQLLDSVFPFVRTLRGIHLRSQVLQLTQGQGCDIVIKSTGGGK